MNRRGFTLIELIATIALLAIIVLIAVPAVNGMIDKNKKNNCQTLEESILRAGKLYISDNKYDIVWNTDGNSKYVTINFNTLYNGYLNTKIKNPCDNNEYTGNDTIKLYMEDGNIVIKDSILPNSFTCCY